MVNISAPNALETEMIRHYSGRRNVSSEWKKLLNFIIANVSTCNDETLVMFLPHRIEFKREFEVTEDGSVSVSGDTFAKSYFLLMLYLKYVVKVSLRSAFSITDELKAYHDKNYSSDYIEALADKSLDEYLSDRRSIGINYSAALFEHFSFFQRNVFFCLSNSLGRMITEELILPAVFNPRLVAPKRKEVVFDDPIRGVLHELNTHHLGCATNPALSYMSKRNMALFPECLEDVKTAFDAVNTSFSKGTCYSGLLCDVFLRLPVERSFDAHMDALIFIYSEANKVLTSIFNKELLRNTKELISLAIVNNRFNPFTTVRHMNILIETTKGLVSAPDLSFMDKRKVESMFLIVCETFPNHVLEGTDISEPSIILPCVLYMYAVFTTAYPTKEKFDPVRIQGFDNVDCLFDFDEFNHSVRNKINSKVNLGNRNSMRVFCGFFSEYAFKFFRKHNIVFRLFPGLDVPDYMRFDYIKYLDSKELTPYELECLLRIRNSLIDAYTE